MKNLKFLALTILLVSFAGLYGCYTQVATDEGRHSRKYHERDYEDSYGQRDSLYGYDNQDTDTSYYPEGTAINNYYLYGDYYRPFYRRYYMGYHPGFSVGISMGWNDPWYSDPWSWAGWYDNYGYYSDPFFSPYYNYPFFSGPYYGSYYGYPGYGHYYGWGNWGIYKYRSNDFTRLRNSDGGRGGTGLRSRDLLSPTRGTNRSLYKTRTQGDTRNTVAPGTRQGDIRTRDQQGSSTLRKGNNNTPNKQRDPAVTRERQRTNQGSYERPRNEGSRNTEQKREGRKENSERKRSNYYNYYWPNQQREGSAPQYNPPHQQQNNAPRRESRGNENRSYNQPNNNPPRSNPPQSRGDGGSRGGSNTPQSRNSGGNDNGRRR